MKILITGVAGFIGSHLAEHLASEGHEVVGVDNFNDYYDVSLKRLNASQVREKGVTIIEANLNDDLEAVLPSGFDYVYHLAAQPGIAAHISLEEYVNNNIFATQKLLAWTLKYNPEVKLFVNIATSSIYGLEATLPETAEVKPISFYGSTKLAAEQLVLGLARTKQMNTCSIRCFSVYGPRERPEKLYTKLIKAIFEGTRFPLHQGSEKHSRSFTYVGDIVKGLAAVIGKETICNGEIFNIGSDQEFTTGEGIALIEKIIGKKAMIQHTAPRPGDQLRTTAIIDKARKLLNYDPTTEFEEGLKQQVAWYRANFVK
ncbi:NAD-dependent epimerase/dehydratase family protein [Sungkyunkwania multivorans]|uniref:NAD-dependent epimerase/dehydratase family protein n=1 Tax=Sungkyunkwania multivorans TaxID=1173618 RepID=A0ABW3CWU0_9FLAO